MTEVSIEVKVLRSRKRADTYLYMPASEQYESLPAALQDQFGEAEEFLTFDLHQQRNLAVVDAAVVLQAIADQGFYLQMPIDPVLLNQMMTE